MTFFIRNIYGRFGKGRKCKHTDGGIHDTVSDFYYVALVDQHISVIAHMLY